MKVRKIVTRIEDVLIDGKRAIPQPSRKVIVAAVLANPFAGQDVDDLGELVDDGEEVGGLLVERALTALGLPPSEVSAYGKGAVVGTDGALEHAAALIHPKFGRRIRAAVGPGAAIIAGTKKAGGPGAVLVVPLANKEDIWSLDEMDAAEISIPDAPAADELVVALALAVGGRPGHRIATAPPENSSPPAPDAAEA